MPGADITSVATRLLEPGFDVSGFLETRKLVAKPEPKRAATAIAPATSAAKLRGTQVVSMSVALAGLKQRAGTMLVEAGALQAAAGASATSAMPMSTPSPQSQTATAALPSRTSLIPEPHVGVAEPHVALAGIRTAPHQNALDWSARRSAAAPLADDAPIEARFELAGQVVPITSKLCSIGSAPESGVRLNDPSVAYLHAQVSQQGNALYLRDAGTQTGTWGQRRATSRRPRAARR